MNYLIGLSFVGGRDYLRRALVSIGERHLPFTHIVNCSEPLETQWTHWEPWTEHILAVPLSHTQVHNYLQVQASGLDALFIQHCDAEAEPDTYDKMLELLPTLPRRWGVVFSNYDSLAMYNPEMWKDIGKWDWRLFPSYYSDNDYYRRAKLAGWELLESHFPVKHEGSHIINKVDKQLKYLNHMLLSNHARECYIRKWGGPPGVETFTVPFDGEIERAYPDS